jgi:hypothetical protein
MTDDDRVFSDNEIEQAWARIGKSPDGKLARRKLISRLLAYPPGSNDLGALAVDKGERIFASNLISLMDAEVEHRADDTAASPKRRGHSTVVRPRRFRGRNG